MLETANTRIDIRHLERELRWDAQKYGFLWSGIESSDPLGRDQDEAADNDLAECIAAAASVSNIEAPAYSMQRYRQPLQLLARIAARGVLYLGSIITHAQTHFNYHVVSGLDKINRRLERIDKASRLHAGILGSVSNAVPNLADQLAVLEEGQAQILARTAQAHAELSNLAGEVAVLRDRLTGAEQSIEAQSQAHRSALQGVEEGLASLAARVSLQERMIQRPVPGGGSEQDPQGTAAVEDRPVTRWSGALDGLYMVFEDRFRGPREEILERLSGYLPLVHDCLSSVEGEGLVLDLGCGRGEWLELLAGQGLKPRGIDNNAGFLVQCEQRGLDVVESDALQYLASLPDASVSIVSGFHIIEHLPFDVLVRLVDEVQRVLHKGGMLVFETPNPKNLIVGACNFYADPTHIRQIFPELLEFVVQSRGFLQAELLYLNPHPPEQQLSAEEAPVLAAQLNGLLSCARDFAVVAYK